MRFGQIGIQLQRLFRRRSRLRICIGRAERFERAENGIRTAQTCPGLRERRTRSRACSKYSFACLTDASFRFSRKRRPFRYNMGQPGHKNCNACHFNGGGAAALSFNPTTPGFPKLDGSPRSFNMTAETNANGTPVALGLPRDGGFGQTLISVKPDPSEPEVISFGNTSGALPGVGLEGFNSPPVVESADTAPFFHNHTVIDLESAVAFYGTLAFQ
jgi:hypothetical protein